MARRHLTLDGLGQGGFFALCRTLLFFIGIGAAAEISGSTRYDGNQAPIAGLEAPACSGDLPSRVSPPVQVVAENTLTEPDRVAAQALPVDDGKKLQPAGHAASLWPGLGRVVEVGRYSSAASLPPITGFQSRAPPAA